MSNLISIKEFAKIHGVTVQAIYDQINKSDDPDKFRFRLAHYELVTIDHRKFIKRK